MDGWVTHWVGHSTNNNKKTNDFAMNWDMFDWRTSLYYRVLKLICVCYKPTVTQVTRLVQHRRAVKQDWAPSDPIISWHESIKRQLNEFTQVQVAVPWHPLQTLLFALKTLTARPARGWKKKPQLRNYRSEMKFPSKTKRCFRYLFVDIAMHCIVRGTVHSFNKKKRYNPHCC